MAKQILTGGEDGSIYAITADGDLLWYGDAYRNGTPGWAVNSGNLIGSGWQDFRLVFGGADGIIYGIKNNGDLLWYRDVNRNGTPGWGANSGNLIGSGWQDFRLVFGGADGIIYGIKNNGDLLWYHDVHRNGTPGWGPNSGNVIGSGWQDYGHAFSGAEGIIYGVDAVGRLRWYVDVPRNGMPGWGARSGEVIGTGWLGIQWSPTLASFGHSTMNQHGKPALGPRRLLVILAEYSNNTANNFPSFSSVHPIEYYELLSFGQQGPPFSTQAPVNPASLDGYFRECSGNRFWLERAGLIGPVAMGVFNDPGPEVRSQRILNKAASLNPRIFFDADLNSDDIVSSSEMLVLIVENIAGLLPANRDNLPLQVQWQIGPFFNLRKTVSLHVAFAGPYTPFYQIAHEVSHSLGTIDMYNSGAGNSLLTLMGGYSFFGNDQGTVHLDAWHKLALGWCEPRRRRLSRPGDELLREITSTRPTAPIILWHPSRGTSEYFLVERRSSRGVIHAYDSGFVGDGVLIWRVTSAGVPPATHLGAPDLNVGGNTVWGSGQTTPPLLWSDGSSTGIRLTFSHSINLDSPSGRNFRVAWS